MDEGLDEQLEVLSAGDEQPAAAEEKERVRPAAAAALSARVFGWTMPPSRPPAVRVGRGFAAQDFQQVVDG